MVLVIPCFSAYQFTVRCTITKQNTKILTYLSVSKHFSLYRFKNLSLCLLHADVFCALQCDDMNKWYASIERLGHKIQYAWPLS